MEKKTIQQADRHIVTAALADIRPSSYNPRKQFDEADLAELAASILQQGVLQPIGIRPVGKDGQFEIVFGERRYRASLLAGKETIPAVILDVSDGDAEEMAVTENLQRKDVTPMEEANAYRKLIEGGRHDVQSLAVLFGKSEGYVRTRLKFTSLIPELAMMLEREELTVSVASEICRYDEDIQRDVYDRHLKEDVVSYNSWRGMKASDMARSIERNYTTSLDRYLFDKTGCLSCPSNTSNMMLFCGSDCGNCADRNCLAEMNTSFITEKAVQMMEQYPGVQLCHGSFNYNEGAVERLSSMGYEVEHIKAYTMAYPEKPEAPGVEDYGTTEEYEEACAEYEDAMAAFEDIRDRSESGAVSIYLQIGNCDVSLCYAEGSRSTSDGTSLSPMEKLERQDERNREIAVEKTVEETKRQIKNIDMAGTGFGADEEEMVYFFLLPYLRSENFGAVGIEKDSPYCYLTDKDRLDVASRLTEKEKAVIRRDFLIANFKDAYGSNATASLLLDFAGKHMPDELAEIRSAHDGVFEKRHRRIEEKKALLLAQEKKGQAVTADGPEDPRRSEKASA